MLQYCGLILFSRDVRLCCLMSPTPSCMNTKWRCVMPHFLLNRVAFLLPYFEGSGEAELGSPKRGHVKICLRQEATSAAL